MKKKTVWMGVLVIALACFVVLSRRVDAMEFHGLRVLSEERLRQMTEGLAGMDSPEDADALLVLDGWEVPYDRAENTFYVSQSTKVAEYAGTFRAVREDCAVYLQEDAALEDKQAAIAQGHAFRLWFVTDTSYTVSQLVFTGLPAIRIDSEQGRLSGGYGGGTIVVQNPNDQDVITMSVKGSAVMIKENFHSGTLSFRLYKDGYGQERNLQLLGLGKRTSWKLYPVYERDGSAAREMLAAYVWNCVCGTESFQKKMAYAEVVIDGEYRGLYQLAPKAGKSYLALGADDRAYRLEERLEDGAAVYAVIGDEDNGGNRLALAAYEELWDEENHDFEQLDIDNYIAYQIWLQAVCGIRNGTEEYDVIAYDGGGTYEFCRVPERSKFVFGIYPQAIGWQSLEAVQAVIEDAPYERLGAELGGAIYEETADRWQKLRAGAMSTDVLSECLYQSERELTESGCIARNADPEQYEAACRELREFLGQRLEFLDGYYESSQAGGSGID